MSEFKSPTPARLPLPKEIRSRTVVDVVWGHADSAPNRQALLAPLTSGEKIRLTYRQIVDMAEQVAGSLRNEGLSRGDHLAIMLTNASAGELVITLLASLRLGAAVVFVSPALKPDEIAFALNLAEVGFVVTNEATASVLRGFQKHIPTIRRIFHTGSNTMDGLSAWSSLMEGAGLANADVTKPHESDPAYIILTSGTTGRPKAVVLSHANAVAAGIGMSRGWGILETDRVQTPIPMTASAGCCVTMMGTFVPGATLIIDPPFDVETEFATVKAERSTVLAVVPSMVMFLLDKYSPERHSMASVRLIAYGSAPMTSATIDQTLKAFPGVELRQIYGLTESSTVGAYLSSEFIRTKMGAVGRPVFCDLQIGDSEGKPLPDGEQGEVQIRGPGVMAGYYKDPDATSNALKGGWLHTGDVGRLDEDGFLYILDRQKDIIIRGGYNITPTEVENAFLHHPAVLEVGVVGIPHPKLGEDVFAFVVCRPGLSVGASELLEHCKKWIADFKVPRRIAFLERLPRNGAGKVLKRQLREDVKALLEASEPQGHASQL